MDHSRIMIALESSEFFKGLDTEEMGRVAGLCKPVAYEAGEFVFQQGDFGEHLYVVVEGQVFLERSMDLGHRQGNVIIAALGRGRILGCWSTLLGEPHILMSSAVCQKPTRLLAMRGGDLREMMLGNTALGFKVMEKFCFLLRDRIQAAYGALEKL